MFPYNRPIKTFIQFLDEYPIKHSIYPSEFFNIIHLTNIDYTVNAFSDTTYTGEHARVPHPTPILRNQNTTNRFFTNSNSGFVGGENVEQSSNDDWFTHFDNDLYMNTSTNKPNRVPVLSILHPDDCPSKLNPNFPEVVSPIKPETEDTLEIINDPIHTISDLILIIDKYDPTKKYNIDVRLLSNIRSELVELNEMIGMETLKVSVLNQLIYFIQGLHLGGQRPPMTPEMGQCPPMTPTQTTIPGGQRPPMTPEKGQCPPMTPEKGQCPPMTPEKGQCPPMTPSIPRIKPLRLTPTTEYMKYRPTAQSISGDFKHTVIYGPPGTGKTEVAKIIGKMYSNLGVFKKGVFKKVTRNDLVAGYLGQTAIKTKNVITDCLGGVLFIDEAYSLSNVSDLDNFSKECIDTLCESLSDHKDDLMVIIAGYEEELEQHFFTANRGLDSRFVWRFKIDSYSPSELSDIFKKKIRESGWSIESDKVIDSKWFESHKDTFIHFGRDMEMLFFYTKISHSRRVFGKPESIRRILTKEDIEKGYELFIKNTKSKKENATRKMFESMYV